MQDVTAFSWLYWDRRACCARFARMEQQDTAKEEEEEEVDYDYDDQEEDDAGDGDDGMEFCKQKTCIVGMFRVQRNTHGHKGPT